MHRTSSIRLLLGLGIALAGCTRDQPPASNQPAPSAVAPAPPSTAPAAPHAQAPQASDALAGTVVETMDAGGYTYAKLDRGGSQVWVAGPATKLAVGTKLGAMSGTLMTGFRSETLKRTFDEIYFVSSFPGATAADPHAGAAAAAPATEKIAPVAGGKTIADVFATKDALAGKPVAVRGKVVKVNSGIMGRNWIHLQDGTGAAGTNDLLITSSAIAKVGDVVVARGTLAKDKDFGGGYRYDLVVEDATLAAQ